MRIKIILLSLLLLLSNSFAVVVSPVRPLSSPVWLRWLVNNPRSQNEVNQQQWQRFLNLYSFTNPQGILVIRYGAVTSVDKNTVAAYLQELSQIPISQFSRQQQLPFWINLYNALVMKIILDNYPINSINDLDPWEQKLMQVEFIPLSLNDVVHRILLPIWQDPRIYYLLNNGTLGSPSLLPVAVTPWNIGSLLDQAAHDFINSGRAVTIENGSLTCSYLYYWNKMDFGGTDQAIIHHLMQYADPVLREQLSHFHKINHWMFNWNLNEFQPSDIGLNVNHSLETISIKKDYGDE